jgi:hypothetical protein
MSRIFVVNLSVDGIMGVELIQAALLEQLRLRLFRRIRIRLQRLAEAVVLLPISGLKAALLEGLMPNPPEELKHALAISL